MLKTMDEVLHNLQSAQAYQCDATSKSGNDVDVMQLNKPSHQCLKFYLNWTQSFATTFYCIQLSTIF